MDHALAAALMRRLSRGRTRRAALGRLVGGLAALVGVGGGPGGLCRPLFGRGSLPGLLPLPPASLPTPPRRGGLRWGHLCRRRVRAAEDRGARRIGLDETG